MNLLFRLPRQLLITTAVLAVMALGTASARAQSEGKQPDLHFLAVGVSKAPAMGPASQLRFAHKDALDLAKVWKKQEGAAYRKVRGETLTDGKAKLADILAGLDRLNAAAKKGDTAVVSISGHGGLAPKTNKWFFCTNNFIPGTAKKADQNGLTDAALRAKLAKMTKRGVTVILLIDTCHSGGFGSSDNILVFAACGAKETSGENDGIKNGIFTWAVLEALQGKADANGDGKVTLLEMKNYVLKRVAKYQEMNPSKDKDGRLEVQRPSLKGPMNTSGKLIVSAQQPVVAAPTPTGPGMSLPPPSPATKHMLSGLVGG